MAPQETAAERHNRMWREEREQAERLRTDQHQPDHWKPNASHFRPTIDLHDPVADHVARWLHPDTRVIDVGAGGGRIAVPLAKHVRQVVAVEPSGSMREVLAQAMSEHNVHNIEIVASTWADAEVVAADLVFAAHVTYSVPDIEPFLRKMDQAATGRVAIVTFSDPAQHVIAPFWQHVYGEERLRLPVKDELVAVLQEMGINPQVDPLPAQIPSSFGSPEDALALLRRRLFIGEGSPAASRLHEAIDVLTELRDGEVWPIHAEPNEVSILSWKPGRM